VEVPLLTRAFPRPSEPVRAVAPFAGETAEYGHGGAAQQGELRRVCGAAAPVAGFRAGVHDGDAGRPPRQYGVVSRSHANGNRSHFVEIYAVSPQHGRNALTACGWRRYTTPDGSRTAQDVLLGGQPVPRFLADAFGLLRQEPHEPASWQLGIDWQAAQFLKLQTAS